MNGKMPELTAYAGKLVLYSAQPLTGTEWEQIGITFLNDIGSSCQEYGSLIGHIKGFLNLREVGYFYLSTVSADQETSSRGEGKGKTSSSYLDFNILVYGIDKAELNVLVSRTATDLAQLFSLTYHIQHDHHVHSHPIKNRFKKLGKKWYINK